MNWKKCLQVSFFLFVISVMISQSAMDAFSILSCIFLIGFWLQQNRKFRLFPKLGLEIPFSLFAGAVCLSFLANWPNQTLALKRIIELKWVLNFYLIVCMLIVLNPEWKGFKKAQIFVWISGLFSLLTPLLGFDPLQSRDAVLDLTPSGVARAGGFFSNPMTFSHLHAIFFFVLVGTSLKLLQNRDKDRWQVLALTLILGFALLMSFTRGVWMGIFAGLVVTGFLFHRRWGVVILLGSILFAVVGIAFVPSIQDRALQVFSPTSYDSERIWIWKANWEIFRDHPLFGIGYGENTLALKSYFEKVGAPSGLLISHAHNQFLNILAGTGVVGLLAYLYLVLLILKKSVSAYLRAKAQGLAPWLQGVALGAIGAQVSFLVGGLTESNFEHAKVRYALMLIWAIPFWIQSILQSNIQANRKS